MQAAMPHGYMIPSFGYSQHEILENIRTLHTNGKFDVDLTYGNGSFWKEIPRPKLCFDLNPKFKFVQKRDSKNTRIPAESIGSAVYDPPFLTYIKQGNDSVMAKRFSGYWAYDDLIKDYEGTLKECNRILKIKGILVFKCQDIIHNHKMHPTHINVFNLAKSNGFRLKDLFILAASNRMPVRAAAHGVQTQKHARIFHSYFMVLEKLKSIEYLVFKGKSTKTNKFTLTW